MTDHAKNHHKVPDAPPSSEPWLPTDGDLRENVADLLLRNRDIVQRRVLGKLRRAGFTGIDPNDIFSSVLRRIDLAVLRCAVRTENEREFWAFVVAVTDNVTLNRLRAHYAGRAADRAGPDRADDARLFAETIGRCDDDDETAACLHRVLMAARDDADRELILWRLYGASYAAMSAATGRSEEALRTQWVRLCQHIRAAFSDERPPPPHTHTHTRTLPQRPRYVRTS